MEIIVKLTGLFMLLLLAIVGAVTIVDFVLGALGLE